MPSLVGSEMCIRDSGVGQRKERKLLCPKPLRALRIPRRVVLRSGSTFHGETALRLLRRRRKALLVARTCNEVVPAHKEFLRVRQTPVPLICIVCWVLACTAPGTRYAFLFFLFSSSGGWVKIKIKLPHFHVCMYHIQVVFRFNPRSRCNSSSRCWYRVREHVDPA